jgi:uncharacterized protein with ATP-grasp and redox domains
MRIFPECYDCLERLVISALEIAGQDDTAQIVHFHQARAIASQHDPNLPPPSMAKEVFDYLHSALGEADLYEQIKIENHQLAMSILDDLRDLLRANQDPFLQAVKIAAVGNIIDVAHSEEYQLWDEVVKQVGQPLLGDRADLFNQKLTENGELLYLADNVGETVFDRVLIEQISKPVVYAVKSGPAMNDATYADAIAAGIDQVAEVVETGSTTPGTFLEDCSPEFRERFSQAGLVLAKGQANYETLDDQGEKIFFLLRMKCPIVAREIGYPVGRLVLRQGDHR